MARKRVFTSGPTVSNGRETVSVVPIRNRDGAILRSAPGGSLNTTTKSRLSRRPIRGIAQPGYQALNYPSPEN